MSILEKQPNESLNEHGARLLKLLEREEITLDTYFDRCADASARAYLSRDNPRAQSGHGSDIYRWRNVRWMILEPIYHDGTFIDVGCANGHLIESLDRWMKHTDVSVEFHGLEISRPLYELARQRLPDFASRLYCGNALEWKPPAMFDYVYSMVLPDIPPDVRKDFLDNLYTNYVKPGGRLILGPWYDDETEGLLEGYGYPVTGYCEKRVPGRDEIKRIVWIDKCE